MQQTKLRLSVAAVVMFSHGSIPDNIPEKPPDSKEVKRHLPR